jgi:hypothetical protein
MAFLERYPVLKRAVANQYQAILLGGAAAFSALTLSPLPLLLLAGAELMVMPFLVDRLKRRLEIEKKFAARKVEAMSIEERFSELSPQSKERYRRLEQLCQKIEANYRGLSPESQSVLADQRNKFDAILASCARRLWLLKKYDEMTTSFDLGRTRAEVEKLRQGLQQSGLDARVREAWQQNLQIKEQLVATVEKNVTARTALLAELDSLDSLLHLLLHKSVAATDAVAFSAEIDDVLAQAEADAQSVAEMEQLMGAMPEMLQPTRGEEFSARAPFAATETRPAPRARTGGTTLRG